MTGMIVSDQWARRHRREAPDQNFEEYLATQAKALGLPMGRLALAKNLRIWRASWPRIAASYISGAAINVDGAKSPVV